MVAFLISRRCLLDPQDKRAATPLIKAVQCPAENCATLLLDHGADPNIEDEIGNTALHYAAYGGNTRMAEKLLSSNADIEKKNETGLTPLLVAIQQNQESMVKFLILQNADVFAIDNLHRTSLMFAGWYNTEDIVHMLLELGVDVLSEDIAGHSARDYALQKRSMQNYQLISLFRENAVLEKTVNTNPDDEHSKEYRKRLLEIPDVNHELLISYEEGLNSFAKKDLIIPGRTTAIIHSAPEEQPNNDRITRVHGVHEDNKCGSEDEAKESTLDPEEGTSTLAGKKSKKRFFITQVAPQQPINKYGMDSDHGLDKDNKHNKESTSQRDPEDSKSQKNSKEGTSTLAGKKSKKRFFITQVAPQQPIMNSDHGLDKDNKCNKESTSQRDPEDSKSQKNSKEGTSTLAGKKSKKRFFITQVAPQQPIMNSDHGLDKDNKCNKESTSQRDPEDSKSQKNSKEESSAEPLKREEVAVPVSGVSDEAVESPWDSEEETSSGKGEVRAATGGVPEGDILDYFLSCSWARIAKERKASMASSGDTEKDVAVSLSAQEHAKDTLSGIAGVPEGKTIDMPGFRPDDEPLKYSLKSEEGMSTVASKKGLKDIAITQVAPHQPVNKYAFNYDRGLDNGNMGNKESTSQRDPEDSKSQKNSKTISTNSWKKSINQSMAADAKRKDMNEPLEEFAKGSTELTPRLEAIHPFWTTSVGMNEVQTCRQDNDIKTTNKEEQEWLDGSKNKQFEEKEQRCQSKEMEVLRNLHESAAPPDDSDGCGLNQQRKSGDLDNQQSATKKNEEYYFCPALHIKETKNENEKVTSMEYGIRPVIENGFSLTRSLLQVIYDNNLSELDRLKREQLRRKEKQYHKEVVVKQLEVTHRTLELDARTSKNNLTQFQESEDEQKELVQNTEKIQDHLEKHDQENHELKDTILKQAREIKNLQEILFRLSSVDMKHLQQQQDDIEKRQCKSEASLREMAQFYLKLNSKMQDIMNKLDEIIRKFQVSENLHQGVVENVKKTQDYLEHYNSRLQSEILEMKDIVKLHAGSIEELQKNLIRPSSVDVKHLQQQHDELQQRQSKSEASLEDMACFYYKLNNKTKDIMDELGEINRKFQEAAALHQEEVQNARKLQDHLEHYNARLKYENSLLKDTIKVQANRIEEQQKYLIRPSSVSPDNVRRCCMNSETEIQKLKKELSDLRRQFKDEQQHIMLLAELNQALQDKLDEEMKKNGDLGDKITQPALCCGPGVQWRMAQVLGPCTPGETRRSAWLLPSDQHGAPATVRQPRRPLEGEPTKKTSCQKSSEYLMESDDISKSIQKEHRIHVGISTLSKMKAPQEAISKELDEYKQLLLEGFEDLRRKQDEIIQVAKAFSKQVNEVNEVLAEVRTKNFLLEKQQTGTLTKSVTTQTSVASHSVGNCANSFWLSRDLTPQQNLETPTSATQASHHNTAESLDTFALQDLDTSTSWGRSFQNTEQYRSQQNFFFMPE
nr:ankyrin repeat domain-containing protein 26 isoform X16 [Oryctolagus cuniculus]XP_051688411.1 ankyrin repeat domain-containing protein 26 isoform X16 [Oryctolagus cuniculus]XP_051688412.1 ankyrin repeat domain-containing protein 26 isoform X16 [Oryctolagus cuniculus]XP_051688413.1 ankyrin repeat domain-containing protein 26 isoform X16 [Oryctolagus cuniculus]